LGSFIDDSIQNQGRRVEFCPSGNRINERPCVQDQHRVRRLRLGRELAEDN
jgi:hypothetical protein